MRPRRHVVVFARAPRVGAVKRRLAAGIGEVAAWRFHRGTAAATLRRLAADRRWQTWLAVTPDRATAAAVPGWRGVARLAQGPGDLGDRMARVLAAFAPAPVAVVGCDIPGLRPHHVAAAFRALAASDVVIGPASDGGYWLIGMRGHPAPFRPFAGVRWSGPHARADTVAALGRRRIALAGMLDDVDDAEGLRRAISAGAR